MRLIIRIYSFLIDALAKFARVLKPRMNKFGKLAAVEMAPPSRAEFLASLETLKNANYRSIPGLTVNEFAARGLVVAEIAFWFYVGEMIGRRSLIGYNPKV